MLRRILAAAVAGMLVSGGCSTGGDSAVDDTTPTTAVQSTVPAATSSTAVEATTTMPPTTTTSTIPTLTLPADGEPWDLLVISNSLGWYVAEPYAARAAEALGVPVNAHDAAIDHLEAWRAMLHLDDVAYPPLSELVRNAEIIVVYGTPERSGDWFDTCWLSQRNSSLPAAEYTGDDWEQYRKELDALFAEVWRLREGLPTVVRTFDMPLGRIGVWRELGKEEACISSWETVNAVHRETADTHGVTMVSLFDLFNGPNHDQDPAEKGWMHGDGIHASEAGIVAIADALAAAGFDPTTQP